MTPIAASSLAPTTASGSGPASSIRRAAAWPASKSKPPGKTRPASSPAAVMAARKPASRSALV